MELLAVARIGTHAGTSIGWACSVVIWCVRDAAYVHRIFCGKDSTRGSRANICRAHIRAQGVVLVFGGGLCSGQLDQKTAEAAANV